MQVEGREKHTQRNVLEMHFVHVLNGGQVDFKPIMQNGCNIALSIKVIIKTVE